MLPRFRVDLEEAIAVSGDDLKTTVAAIFEKVGVPTEDALLGADVLVLADLRGVDSHGVSNMLRSYLGGYQRGEINPRPNITVVRETAATASVDSDRGLGTIVTPKAMDIAIQKAREVGVGMVTIGNSRHLGMASYHAMLAPGTRHDWRLHDQRPAPYGAYFWRRAAAGNESHRGGGAGPQRAALCL